MRGLWVCVALCLLTGCSAPVVYETVEDGFGTAQQVSVPGRIKLNLPENCWMQTFTNGSGTAYGTDDMEVYTCVLPSVDQANTWKILTGLSVDAIAPVSTGENTWEAAWTTATERGLLVCRTGIWERDGYHYCVSLMMPEEHAQKIADEFRSLVQSTVISDIDP